MGRPALSVKDRLLDYHVVDPSTGCWLWTKGTCSGYGRISVMHKSVNAHVASAMQFRGFIPTPGLCVLHSCDNRRCINPDHFFFGTKGDNNRDCYAKKRHPKVLQTHCKRGHLLSGDNISKHPSSGCKRRCLACHRDDQRRRNEAAKGGTKFSWKSIETKTGGSKWLI